jgi:hypothetical protein
MIFSKSKIMSPSRRDTASGGHLHRTASPDIRLNPDCQDWAEGPYAVPRCRILRQREAGKVQGVSQAEGLSMTSRGFVKRNEKAIRAGLGALSCTERVF